MTVKLLHAADIHIGMENYGKVNPATGLSTRLEDFCATFDEAIDRAIAESVDLVVLAGDIYKTRDPTPTHQREFAARIRRLIGANIPVFIAPGNHDIPLSTSRATSVDIFRTLELPGVTVARAIGKWTVPTRSGPIQVLALPWVIRSQILARDEFKNKTIEELNVAMVELASAKLRELAETLDSSLPAIVVGHAHVHGARVGAERLLLMGSDPVFDLATFDLPHVSYVALGHIHKHQVLSYGTPKVVYSGSINRVDFSEEREDKGYVIAEVEAGGGCDFQFYPVQARPFLTIEARAESDDPTAEVLKAIFRAGEKVRESVVRLRIQTTRAASSQLDEDEIRGQLKEAFYLLPIQKELVDEARERAIGRDFNDKDPLELLQIYLETKETAPDRRETLAKFASDLMQETA